MTTPATFESRRDAIDQAITPALDNPAAYDLDGIFDAAFTYDPARRVFVQTVTVDEFWAAVANNAR